MKFLVAPVGKGLPRTATNHKAGDIQIHPKDPDTLVLHTSKPFMSGYKAVHTEFGPDGALYLTYACCSTVGNDHKLSRIVPGNGTRPQRHFAFCFACATGPTVSPGLKGQSINTCCAEPNRLRIRSTRRWVPVAPISRNGI